MIIRRRDNVEQKPYLLDLYCGAGGCSKGYADAGFEVIGVDIEDQPRYPYQFIKYDAKQFLIDYDLSIFSAIHASPPCQQYSATNHFLNKQYADDIWDIRFLLVQTEKPYIIENVPEAPLRNSVMLCGKMFGLDVIRHRLFESNITLFVPEHEKHHKQKDVSFMTVTGSGYSIEKARKAMGIDWMIKKEMSQAIPPDYTEFLGRQLYNYVRQRDNVDILDYAN